jgi:hypothetical protein
VLGVQDLLLVVGVQGAGSGTVQPP